MLVMMMENQTTASSIGVDDNCNIQKGHCTVATCRTVGRFEILGSGGANSNSSLLKEKVLLLYSWQNMRRGFGRPPAPLPPSGSEGPIMYSSKYIVGLTKAGFQDCYEIPIIMISLSLFCSRAQGNEQSKIYSFSVAILPWSS